MNIDELKNAWNGDDSFEEVPEISIEQAKKINLPLEKMRKNMRKEFWYTLVVFIFSFFVVAICNAPLKFKFYVLVLVASMAFVTIFFFSKFFKLYKELSNPALQTYDALNDLLMQFNLNKQYYLSFYVSFIPFLVCEIILVIEVIPWMRELNLVYILMILIGFVVVGGSLVYLSGKRWFEKFYGKHIRQIENLLIELKK
ncbi:hypothetical protein JI747_013050 [Chryseobacterium sp. RG1]|uniref:Uncharacterized protein n=1 Tax=Chryseobacterium tagetis TaxID=2801334 RepID=A0ABS8A5Z1_9FLAO|nr:hypothetical protein [Chryseobacterium tagetis]MCA6068116.1 hypothetical protein [Chryseobacterium tagetis]